MQLRGLIVLGIALGAEATKVVRFRDVVAKAELAPRQNSPAPSSTAVDVVTQTTTKDDTTTSDDSQTTSSDSSSSTDTGDTTITKTITVTASGDTATKTSTVSKTSTSTLVVTSTVFQTDTVTSTGKTATKTVYETTTQWANQKRAINIAPRTVDQNGIVIFEAEITKAPEVEYDDEDDLLLRPREMLAKRDTVTETKTVTVGGDSGSTVTDTITKNVISTTSSVTKVTKTITETDQVDASTTVSVTSTLTVTSTRVTTGVVETSTSAPTETSDASNSGSKGSSGGLSTGAKAGIGAGAGVAGLIALGLLLWCCFRRRNKPSKSEIDDMFGSSEVPVGPGPGTNQASRLSSTRMTQMSPTIPTVSPMKSAPEGYRGTALGDGRAGYAKPKPFGAAYAAGQTGSPDYAYSRTATTTSGGDERERMDLAAPNAAELGNDGNTGRWHESNAAEIDGNQVSSLRGNSPAQNVYEMPTQEYR
ncbi:hypothetical protein BGZ63DRAFT_94365 [Mariannaea sp. PMI_226]|nr:hypothetical protein BGZ63DRAFT_94365 [Mariannaea sp. PMI_226]